MANLIIILKLPIIQVLLRQALLLFGLWCFYNRLDPRDIKTMLFMFVGDGAVTTAAGAMRKQRDD